MSSEPFGGLVIGRQKLLTKAWQIVDTHWNGDTRCVIAAAPELEKSEEARFDVIAAHVCRRMQTDTKVPIEYYRPVCGATPATIGEGHIVCMVPPGKHTHTQGKVIVERDPEPWAKSDESAEDAGDWTPRVGDVLRVLVLDVQESPTVESLIDQTYERVKALVALTRDLDQEGAAERLGALGALLEDRLTALEGKLDRLLARGARKRG